MEELAHAEYCEMHLVPVGGAVKVTSLEPMICCDRAVQSLNFRAIRFAKEQVSMQRSEGFQRKISSMEPRLVNGNYSLA